jgi:uncharacterized membrane protein
MRETNKKESGHKFRGLETMSLMFTAIWMIALFTAIIAFVFGFMGVAIRSFMVLAIFFLLVVVVERQIGKAKTVACFISCSGFLVFNGHNEVV